LLTVEFPNVIVSVEAEYSLFSWEPFPLHESTTKTRRWLTFKREREGANRNLLSAHPEDKVSIP
jgi:hypothetical protein